MATLRNLISSLFGSYTPGEGYTSAVGSVGMNVIAPSPDSSLSVAAVYSGVKLISEGVARLALTLQRYNSARGRYTEMYDTPLYVALRMRPNANMTSFDMWRGAMQQVLLRGNAYIWPTHDVFGEVVELTLLSPDTVTYDITTKLYNINDPIHHIYKTARAEELVHLRNIGIDGGYTGLSVVQLAAQALGIVRLSDQNTASTLSNGGRMRGILSGNTGVSTFGSATMSQLAGVSDVIEKDMRTGRTVIPVPSDMKFQPITLSPADAKVLESKQVTIRDLARFLRVHPDLLYEGSNNTYKAAEVPNVMFLTQTLEPLLVQIETELLTKLVPRQFWGRRRIRFDREAMYMTDLQTEAAYFEKMLQTGVYTVNELRAKKGQAAIEGGDKLLVSANLKTMDAIVQEAPAVEPENKNKKNNGEEETNS